MYSNTLETVFSSSTTFFIIYIGIQYNNYPCKTHRLQTFLNCTTAIMETISFITSAISTVVTLLIGILIGRCFNNNINYNNSKHHVNMTQLNNPVKKKK